MQCSAEHLPPRSDVMTMVLYHHHHHHHNNHHPGQGSAVVAVVNLKTKTCTTTEAFVSCDAAEGNDSRRSRVRVLVDDLTEGQSRVYGCNVSALVSGVRMETYSWAVSVRREKSE